ncbi:MAG: hypothetical protein RR797_03200 [Christensenella sp.]
MGKGAGGCRPYKGGGDVAQSHEILRARADGIRPYKCGGVRADKRTQ